ncbi:hypothetical protein BV25DRAFT_1833527 [Artomyces pyxidatus]|uniref:Uncharacterized protein n=1 Tax=Artomyces pyxidatus TaxID=48021 RepID=A0ACB8SF19_9AGAM|nr:hypothetical protein BV25DRAFT_1833527 [Artomyces pyxidatus]
MDPTVEVAERITSMSISDIDEVSNATEFWSSVLQGRLTAIHCDSEDVDTRDDVARMTRDLHDELAAIQRASRRVKAQLNHLRPISRLPPEIFAHILRLYAASERPHCEPVIVVNNDYDYEPMPREILRSGLGWLKATHVCRRWRQIALEHTELWRQVDATLGYRWAQEMISRAKSASLSLTVDISISRAEFIGDMIIANLHNIRKLELTCIPNLYNDSNDRVALCLSKGPAPLLESLVFLNRSHNVLIRPATLLEDGAPCLRHLTVHGYGPFAWHSQVLRQLVHFDISEGMHTSYEDILFALEEMNVLEVLTLYSGEVTSPHRPLQRAGRFASLPSLVQFTLTGALTFVEWLLTHMRIAKTVKVSITCRGTSQRSDFQSILPILADTGCNLGYPRIAYGSLSKSGRDRLFFTRAWSTVNTEQSIDRDRLSDAASDFHLAFNWVRRAGSHDQLALMIAVHQTLSVRKLADLQIGVQGKLWTPWTWADIFKDCSESMESIRVNSLAAPSFVAAIADNASSGGLNGQRQSGIEGLFAPQLATLGIKSHFDLTDEEDSALYTQLVAALQERKKHGAVLRHLVLPEHLLPAARLRELHEVVPCIASW